MNAQRQWVSGILGGLITALVVGCAASVLKVQGVVGFMLLAAIGGVMGLIFVRGQQHRPRESVGHARPVIEKAKRSSSSGSRTGKREAVAGIKAQIKKEAKEATGGQTRKQERVPVPRPEPSRATKAPAALVENGGEQGEPATDNSLGSDGTDKRLRRRSSGVAVQTRTKDKLRGWSALDAKMVEEAVSALGNLGFNKRDARAAVEAVRAAASGGAEADMMVVGGVADVGQLVVQCMRWMKGPRTQRLEPAKGDAQ